MDILTIMQRELDCLNKMTRQFQQILKNMPAGNLHLKRRPTGQMQFYYKIPGDPKQHYISTRNTDLIETLKYKRFLEEGLKLSSSDAECIRHFMKHYKSFDYSLIESRLPDNFRQIPTPHEAHSLLQQYSSSPSQHFTQSQNPYHPEHLIHHTTFGLIVRSKSEAMIADVLFDARFNLHYEKELILRDNYGQFTTVYPDFTIPLSGGRTLYWEHAGRLGEPEYRERHNRKMQLYFMNGIYEPKNLIVTCDGPNQEFDLRDIRRIVENIENM